MESFTDGRLISLALRGDREAVTDICKLISRRVERINNKLLNTRFWLGVKYIGEGQTPNDAFEWEKNPPSQDEIRSWLASQKEFRDDVQATRQSFSENDTGNDADLYAYICIVLEALVDRRSPDEAFKWKQSRKGRRVANVNVFRDWDIQMTVRDLMIEGYIFSKACEIVDKASPYPIGYDSILKIANGVTENSDLPLPDGIFPLPKKAGITQAKLDEIKLEYKRFLSR